MTLNQQVVGRGSREQVRPGVWRVRFNLGYDPVAGRYAYSPWRTIHTTSKRKLDSFAEAYKRELNEGIAPTRSTRATAADYISDYHLAREGTLKESYYDREGLLVREAADLLGAVRLTDLTPALLRRVYAAAREEGRLSDSELYMVHALVRRVLKQAVADEVIARNPALAVDVPKPEHKHRASLSAAEAARFKGCLIESEPSSYVVASLLLLETGCRRGEALGLTWDDVLLDSRRVLIRRQLTKKGTIDRPKSKTSVRRVAISEETAGYLREWQSRQAELLASRGFELDGETFVASAFQAKYEITEDEGAVRRLACGHLDAGNFNRWFCMFCVDHGFGAYTKDVRTVRSHGKTVTRGAGYVGLTPHGLRHTQATLLIGSGADLKTVQVRLGHSDPGFTLRQYTDAIESNDDAAAATFDTVLDRASSAEGRAQAGTLADHGGVWYSKQ